MPIDQEPSLFTVTLCISSFRLLVPHCPCRGHFNTTSEFQPPLDLRLLRVNIPNKNDDGFLGFTRPRHNEPPFRFFPPIIFPILTDPRVHVSTQGARCFLELSPQKRNHLDHPPSTPVISFSWTPTVRGASSRAHAIHYRADALMRIHIRVSGNQAQNVFP